MHKLEENYMTYDSISDKKEVKKKNFKNEYRYLYRTY